MTTKFIFTNKKAAKKFDKKADSRELVTTQAAIEAAGYVRQSTTAWYNREQDVFAVAPAATDSWSCR